MSLETAPAEQMTTNWKQKISIPSLITRLQDALETLGTLFDRHTELCIWLLVASFLPLSLMMAHAQPLTADEVYTFQIAQQPTIHRMIEVSRLIDLHPPLHFLAERWSLLLPLPTWLGSRLASLIAGQLTLIVLFLLVRRLSGNLAGLMAASALWFTPAFDFAWSNRPYALWILFLSLSALLWMRSIEPERRWWEPVLLAAAALAMVENYMFGLPCLLPFFLAEAVRFWRTRRLDLPVLAALVLPSFAGLAYLEQIRAFAVNTFTATYLPSFGMGIGIYREMLSVACWIISLCMLIALLLRRERPQRAEARLRIEHWTMMGALVLLPALLLLLASIHKTQFFSRYAICATVGIALLITFGLARLLPQARVVFTLMTLCMLGGALYRMDTGTDPLVNPKHALEATGTRPVHLEELDPNIPIVVAAATEFTEMNNREPLDIGRRLFYLTDWNGAKKYSGQTLFEGEARTIALLGLPGHAEPLPRFVAEHPMFYLIGDYTTSEEWVMRDLVDHGAHIEIVGTFFSLIGPDYLYRVTVK